MPSIPRPERRDRLGVYQDGPFAIAAGPDGPALAPDPVDAPFLRFVIEVGEAFESLVVFARVASGAVEAPAVLLPSRVEAVELPDYGSLRRLVAVGRTTVGTARAFWAGLDRVDVVWAFGPHPFQLLLVLLATLRGKRVVVGVRQDTVAYFRARLPARRWAPVLAPVYVLDRLHRLVGRRVPATVVGAANLRRYSRGPAPALELRPSLVRAADVVAAPAPRDWGGPVSLLTVGRVDAEKNPLLLVDALAALERERPGRFRLRWVGTGPMLDDVRRRAASLGVEDRVELLGYVPFGPDLLALYRAAHLFVHVSLTEGVPQVLVEALASGTPVVATDVGGVRAALGDGEAGLLVPPSDATGLTEAVVRLCDDAELRARLVARGLELAADRTLEVEAARAARFLRRSS